MRKNILASLVQWSRRTVVSRKIRVQFPGEAMAKGAVGGVVNACYSRFHFFGSAGSNPAQPLAFAFAAVALSVYKLDC